MTASKKKKIDRKPAPSDDGLVLVEKEEDVLVLEERPEGEGVAGRKSPARRAGKAMKARPLLLEDVYYGQRRLPGQWRCRALFRFSDGTLFRLTEVIDDDARLSSAGAVSRRHFQLGSISDDGALSRPGDAMIPDVLMGRCVQEVMGDPSKDIGMEGFFARAERHSADPEDFLAAYGRWAQSQLNSAVVPEISGTVAISWARMACRAAEAFLSMGISGGLTPSAKGMGVLLLEYSVGVRSGCRDILRKGAHLEGRQRWRLGAALSDDGQFEPMPVFVAWPYKHDGDGSGTMVFDATGEPTLCLDGGDLGGRYAEITCDWLGFRSAAVRGIAFAPSVASGSPARCYDSSDMLDAWFLRASDDGLARARSLLGDAAWQFAGGGFCQETLSSVVGSPVQLAEGAFDEPLASRIAAWSVAMRRALPSGNAPGDARKAMCDPGTRFVLRDVRGITNGGFVQGMEVVFAEGGRSEFVSGAEYVPVICPRDGMTVDIDASRIGVLAKDAGGMTA